MDLKLNKESSLPLHSYIFTWYFFFRNATITQNLIGIMSILVVETYYDIWHFVYSTIVYPLDDSSVIQMDAPHHIK